MQNEKLQLFHYKNGIFHGYIKNMRKNGGAITIFDNGAIFIGNFNNDQINDKCVIMLEHDIYFLGTFKKGMIDGNFSIRTPQFSIYSQSQMNRVEGDILVINKKLKRGRVWEITNGQGVCIREGQYNHQYNQQKIAKSLSPYTKIFPTLFQYFTLNSNNYARFNVKIQKSLNRIDLSMEVKALRKLNIKFEENRVISWGIMTQNIISGLGYIFNKTKNIEQEGQISNNQLHGEGMIKQISTKKTIYGKFQKGDIQNIDIFTENSEQIAANLIRLKKKIHIHSVEFTNDYINQRPILLLKNFLNDIIQNQLKFNQFKKELSTSRFSVNFSRQKYLDESNQNISEDNKINLSIHQKRIDNN